MKPKFDLAKFKAKSELKDRYEGQLSRLRGKKLATGSIEQAVNGALENLETAKMASLVIYGEPQSGKTEMMICLTARLLDEGHKIIVHLMNDSVDLLSQNLKRFKQSGLAPAAKIYSEVVQLDKSLPIKELVIFCKKNARDLEKLLDWIKGIGPVVVIDDEADYATPNSKVNQGQKTAINSLVDQLIGESGFYIGVTATPARLDLNHTFENDTEKWVNFPPHEQYTGQDVFFPLNKKVPYRLTLLNEGGNQEDARKALLRFLVTVAHLNTFTNTQPQNYTMLVHTSGRKEDHETDRGVIEDAVRSLIDGESTDFDDLIKQVFDISLQLYPDQDPDVITEYVVTNASRATSVVLNSERDRMAAGDSATEPSSPFTIIIGGNIVSRGVTFPNLLSMFFTRGVQHKLQQDTYIQRARMFGARGDYLKHFELTIPESLYLDWHRCFVFHRLALATVRSTLGSPVWLSDSRISPTASTSINKATVSFDKGEMSFQMFDFTPELDDLVRENQTNIDTLQAIRKRIGNDALPEFLINYISVIGDPGTLAIHTASSIEGYSDDQADKIAISRAKGFMGKSQREEKKFPNAIHHIKIFYNNNNKAKLFYKFKGSIQFIQNLKAPTESFLNEPEDDD